MTSVVAGILERDGKILICQRRADQDHPLKWEFPGGKVEAGELPGAALVRELEEELGIAAASPVEITRYEYSYPGKNPILLIFFRVSEWRGEVVHRIFEKMVWESADRLGSYDFLEGDLPFLRSGGLNSGRVKSAQRKIDDWLNLPEDVITLSLWDSLHDGQLLKIESDLLARTVTLNFDVPYIRTFHKLPEQTEFVVTITGVESVRLAGSVKWPGQFCVPEGASRDEESKLVAGYWAKWREESRSWGDFEAMTSSGVEVLNATLARGADTVALHLGVMSEGDSYLDAFIRGQGIDFFVGDRQVVPEGFIALGEAYWAAFANKKLPLSS